MTEIQRDPRWENVEGTLSWRSLVDEEIYEFFEVRLVVPFKDSMLVSQIHIFKSDYEEFGWDLIKPTLDKMIEQIDEVLEIYSD